MNCLRNLGYTAPQYCNRYFFFYYGNSLFEEYRFSLVKTESAVTEKSKNKDRNVYSVIDFSAIKNAI
jgi:hypothetical protein